MKHTLLIVAVCLFTAAGVFAATNAVIYKVNFESPLYTAGIELNGQNDWTEITNNPAWHGYVTNDITAPDGDNQCVYMECVDGYYQPINATGYDRTKFSGKFNMLPGGNAIFLEFMYHWSIGTGIKADRGNGICFLNLPGGTEVHDDANAALGDWVYASYTIDWTLMQIVEAEFGTVKVDLSIDISSSWISQPVRIHMKSWNPTQANSATKFDDLLVEYVPRTSTAKMSVVPPALDLNSIVTQGVLTVANQGTDPFTYTAAVIDSPPWMILENPGGTVTNEQSFRFFLDRSLMSNDFYRAKIIFAAGAAGSATVSVSAASGNVLYKVNFGPDYYTAGIELNGQDGWTEDTAQSAWFGYVLEDETAPDGDDQCVYMDCINGYYHKIAAAGYDRLKFSGWFNILPNGNALNLEFMYHWKIPVTIKPDYDAGFCYLVLPGGTEIYDNDNAVLGQWVYASYTIDLFLHQVVAAEFGSKKLKFTDVYIDDTISSVNQIHMKAWNYSNTNSACKFDDLIISYVEPGDAPELSTITYKYFGRGETTYNMPLSNIGTGSYEYTCTIIDPEATWLSVSPTNGTIVTTGQATLQVNRTGLASDYYRARVVIDAGAAGVITTRVAMSHGTVYYEADFEEPHFVPGELNGQDVWDSAEPQYYSAYVTNGIYGNTSASVYVHNTKFWEGYQHAVEMPADLIVKVGARLYVPNNPDFGSVHIVTRSWWDRVAESYITLSNDLCYLNWEDHPGIEVPPPVPADTWFDFYFIVDFKDKLLLEVGMGGESVEYADEYFLNIGVDRVHNIGFMGTNTNDIDECGASIDDVYVEEIPEPGTAGALLLLFVAVLHALKRR